MAYLPLSDTAGEWVKYLIDINEDMANINRKAASKKVCDYYNDAQKSYLEKELAKIYSDPYSFSAKRKWVHNYTRQLVEASAQCYSCKVRRDLPVRSKKLREEINNKVFFSLNSVMETANRWLVLERMALVFTKWSDKYQRMIYKTYNQYQYDLVFDPTSDEKELMAVVISDYNTMDKSNFYIYTRNKYYRFYGKDLQQEIEHNLGLVPFVVMYSQDPGFEDYLLPNEQIADGNLELNIANSNLLNMLQNKAHGVWVLKRAPQDPFPGIDDGDPNLSTPNRTEMDRRIDIHDPAKVLELTNGPDGEESDLKVVSPDTDFNGAIETIRFLADSFANSFGADGSIFESRPTDNPATLYRINEDKRQGRLRVYQMRFVDAEKELFGKSYKLASLANPGLPQDLNAQDLSVEFISEKLILEELNMNDLLSAYDKGVLDLVEVIRKIYPGMNREEALDFIEKMRKDEELLQPEEAQQPNSEVKPSED